MRSSTTKEGSPGSRFSGYAAIWLQIITLLMCIIILYKISSPGDDQFNVKPSKTASELAQRWRDQAEVPSSEPIVPSRLVRGRSEGAKDEDSPDATTTVQSPESSASLVADVPRESTLSSPIPRTDTAEAALLDDYASKFVAENNAVRLSILAIPLDTPVVPQQYRIPSETAMVQQFLQHNNRLNARQVAFSSNPPQGLGAFPEASRSDMSKRLVIAVGGGVHSGKTDVQSQGIYALPLMKDMVPSLIRVAQPWHIYRVYVAYDFDDPFYSHEASRTKVQQEFDRLVLEEDKKRWHPTGYSAGSVDYSTIVITLHWVKCNYNKRPAVAHSDAMIAAYREGADYALRINDDTSLPTALDWVDQFVYWLRTQNPIPNFGVIGPKCISGNMDILTHDFTHVTHAMIFGFLYPYSLTDWSSDDWITHMYNYYHRMQKSSIEVIHHIHDRRYDLATGDARLAALNWELYSGTKWIDAWTQENFGIKLHHDDYEITCC